MKNKENKNQTDPVRKIENGKVDNKDNLDSRRHEEQTVKGDDVTSNEKETKEDK